ncbi:hypothetical protein JVT61DRAFT_3125 [Boletus reticuloceps]|uniref:Uncharacterized protein n=1 Tax=Boletus reticuloceps TaxID=495285 RepID=A0A8I3AAM5_9AGAM|nr:hypothetical protein JVT61DRAFT_3125 [Boletus reticuloceps]
MSSPPSIPRPPSRSQRLLRDTLRKDDTLRTYGPLPSRPRSNSSTCDDDEDDNIFQSAILRRSSRRNSAASALSHGHPNGFYVPDQDEHASYSRLLRSSSHSGSSRSGRSDRRASSPRPAYTPEKQEELSRHHDAAPHEAVLRSRLDSVIHSMGIDRHGDALEALTHLQSSTASLSSSLSSISGARAHSPESHQTHLTIPDTDPCVPPPSRREPSSHRPHRYTRSTSAVHRQPTTPPRTSASPRVTSHCSPSPRSPRGIRSPPQTPMSHQKEQLKRQHPDSPWTYVPLPPSPPTFSASPSKRGGPAVVTFVAGPPIVDAHTHIPTRSPACHSPHTPSTFDPEAASHALRKLPGYVSFASVAGLGAPPEEEDRPNGHKPFSGFTLGGVRGRFSDLGLGSGKWWMF